MFTGRGSSITRKSSAIIASNTSSRFRWNRLFPRTLSSLSSKLSSLEERLIRSRVILSGDLAVLLINNVDSSLNREVIFIFIYSKSDFKDEKWVAMSDFRVVTISVKPPVCSFSSKISERMVGIVVDSRAVTLVWRSEKSLCRSLILSSLFATTEAKERLFVVVSLDKVKAFWRSDSASLTEMPFAMDKLIAFFKEIHEGQERS